MDVKVRCCPLDPNHPAADGSIIASDSVGNVGMLKKTIGK